MKWSSSEEVCIEHDITNKIEAINSAESMKEFKVNIYDILIPYKHRLYR